MLVGSVVIKMLANSKARLPVSHGRLLHAALLNLVRERDPKLSECMHDSNINNFSVSLLKVAAPIVNFAYEIKEGTAVYWRVGAIGDRLLELLWELPQGMEVRVGAVNFNVSTVFRTEKNTASLSCIDTDILEHNIMQLPELHSITIDFVAPTTFSGPQGDIIFPMPKLIFASLADKWNAFSENTKFNVKYIKEVSEYLYLTKWEGRSCRYNLSPIHTVMSFVGSFTYSLKALPEEYQKIFLLLLEFAVYTGVGRYTGQGMGKIEISYK